MVPAVTEKARETNVAISGTLADLRPGFGPEAVGVPNALNHWPRRSASRHAVRVHRGRGRRVVASVACALLLATGCTYQPTGKDASSRGVNAPAATTTTTLVAEIAPVHDFGTEFTSDSGRRVVGVDARSLDVGFYYPADGTTPAPAVFAFDGFAGEPECLDRASLTITLQLDAGAAGVPLVVYAGRAELAGLRTGDGVSEMLLDNRPRGGFTFSGDTGTADVTELLRTWLGRAFPSRGVRVGEGDPLVLVVQPPTATSQDFTKIRATEAGPGSAPTLRVHTRC